MSSSTSGPWSGGPGARGPLGGGGGPSPAVAGFAEDRRRSPSKVSVPGETSRIEGLPVRPLVDAHHLRGPVAALAQSAHRATPRAKDRMNQPVARRRPVDGTFLTSSFEAGGGGLRFMPSTCQCMT